MAELATTVLLWVNKKPIASSILALVALLGYANVFLFGFVINVPVALRPFLDAYFFSSLALEFFISVAISGVVARFVLLLSRLLFSNFPLKPSQMISGMMSGTLGLKKIVSRFFDMETQLRAIDRRTMIQLKLVSRWMRRQKRGGPRFSTSLQPC